MGSDEFSVPGSAGRRGRCCPYSLRALGPVLLLMSYTPRGGLYRFPRAGSNAVVLLTWMRWCDRIRLDMECFLTSPADRP